MKNPDYLKGMTQEEIWQMHPFSIELLERVKQADKLEKTSIKI